MTATTPISCEPLADPVQGHHYCADCGIALWKRQTIRRVAFDGYVYVCLACYLNNPFDPMEPLPEAWEG